MKNKKVLIAAILLVVAVFGIKYLISMRQINVVKGSVLMENNNQWNGIIADYVNDIGVKINVDGSVIPVAPGDVYMDKSRNMLVSHNALTTMLACATNLYDNNSLVVEKSLNSLTFTSGNNILSFNGKNEEMAIKPLINEGSMYVPLRVVCQKLSYEYEWNYDTNMVTISNLKPDEKVFPYTYDYRNNGRITTVRNQANLGTCWAFASLTALTTSLLPEVEYDFSPDHMSRNNGYNLTQEEGGDYTMAMAYLAAWKGPVLEVEDPYGDGVSPENLKPSVHVQEMQILESKNYDKIKKTIFLYGGVQSSLYMSMNDADGRSSQYYNADNSAYCYIGTQRSNHDVVIVGWDDSYPASNFSTAPEGDGAFICVNSWGEQFGENGYFYVSYFDSNIGIYNVAYTSVQSSDNYDNIYQSDMLGWVGQIGYNRENAYFSNVYEAKGEETLEAIGFYAIGPNTEYEIYYVDKFAGEQSFASKRFLTKGLLANAGYYTVEINEEIKMAQGEKLAIIINIKTPNSERPVAIEYNADKTGNVAAVDDGEGYISANGKNWERVEESQNCNICLKFYTNDIEGE